MIPRSTWCLNRNNLEWLTKTMERSFMRAATICVFTSFYASSAIAEQVKLTTVESMLSDQQGISRIIFALDVLTAAKVQMDDETGRPSIFCLPASGANKKPQDILRAYLKTRPKLAAAPWEDMPVIFVIAMRRTYPCPSKG